MPQQLPLDMNYKFGINRFSTERNAGVTVTAKKQQKKGFVLFV